ncbi:PREDICTED: uncharacterized protein LOC106102282 [Papilio polytes]|uniref:uncharacterized protein LOC106102282 n=1 Tax=Papilio polytes TaxID=76194 RepID=UPI000675FA40|nr:PREDICTED: uncharacterized protein LOC106102282 [Papilio polytes]
MFFLLFWYAFSVIYISECAVLDPALYLQPSPPIRQADEYLWSQPTETTDIIPINVLAPIDREESIPKGRTFWPKLRTDYRLGSIHIPLTFSVSGTYGNYGDSGSVVGTSYASVSGLGNAKAIESKPTLAGTGYDNYNSSPTVVRIYGSSNKPAWSGWGNGKWGHYGKG